MLFTRTSPLSKKNYSLDLPVTREQLNNWKKGMLIQNAFPQLSPAERDFIKLGITPDEWEQHFANHE